MHPNCSVCHAQTHKLFTIRSYDVAQCRSCRHVTIDIEPTPEHVRQIYNDSYFNSGGLGYPNYLAEESIVRAHGARYALLLARYATPGRLLDIGCAAGFTLDAFVSAGWSGVGVEPNETMARHAREKLGLDVAVGTAERYPPLAIPVDLVTMIQVIAHVVDIDAALENVRSALIPGGLFLVETWNAWSWTSRVLGRYWHEYSPPSVLRIFSRDSLERIAARHGFERVASGCPRKRISAEHAKALLAEKGNDSRLLRALCALSSPIPDHWILPYPAEDLFWSLFRKV